MILDLLGGADRFAEHWPVEPYHCPGAAAGLRETLRAADVDRLINEHALQAPAFRMVRADRVVTPETITRSPRATSQGVRGLLDPGRAATAFAAGATLILQGADRHWSPLSDACRRLSGEVGHAVFVNAYLTPPRAQGFAAHQDPYHAWLVQTEGEKRWQLWAPECDPAADPPGLDIVLREGDVLWIPLGWWHGGRSEASVSLHLTFTVWATTVEDVLRAVVGDLNRRQALGAPLAPHAFERPDAAVRDALGEIGKLIGDADVTGRVLAARAERFPAPPVSLFAAE
jgi:bifunctional lysine-specific demethylase and histidyl-hydroxylase NO66